MVSEILLLIDYPFHSWYIWKFSSINYWVLWFFEKKLMAVILLVLWFNWNFYWVVFILMFVNHGCGQWCIKYLLLLNIADDKYHQNFWGHFVETVSGMFYKAQRLKCTNYCSWNFDNNRLEFLGSMIDPSLVTILQIGMFEYYKRSNMICLWCGKSMIN